MPLPLVSTLGVPPLAAEENNLIVHTLSCVQGKVDVVPGMEVGVSLFFLRPLLSSTYPEWL